MPQVYIECAFDNDYDENAYAQTGYTDITQFVNSMGGDLRGRKYEVGRVEAGTISLVLDNADGRFTPGRPSSPYYPNVKANRRLRIRGRNMLPPNLATTGYKERDTTGFRKGSDPLYNTGIGDPQYAELGFGPVTAGADPSYIFNIYPSGTIGWRRLIEWYGPVEFGVRLVHSAYIWRLQGTEVTGALVRFEVHYMDNDDQEITSTIVSPRAEIAQPVPVSPTRTIFSHTPPANAKYALMTVAYYSPTAPSTDIHIAVSAAQTELPVNLAPNPSGYHDVLGWNQEEPTGTKVPVQDTTNQSVRFDWTTADIATSLIRAGTVIPHLIPGEKYSASMEVWITGTENHLVSVDEGQSGVLVTTKGSWVTVNLTDWTALQAEQALDFYPQVSTTIGNNIRVRRLNVVKGSTSPGLASSYGDVTDATTWEYPKPIFEGWVESWPVQVGAGSTDVTISVVDRLARMSNIQLENVLSEMLFNDKFELILPLTESPSDSQGAVSNIGLWADTSQLTQVDFQAARGDIGAAAYTLGVDGPTGETALLLTPVSDSQGYSLPIPHSIDFNAPSAPVPVKPPGGSNTAPTRYTYTRIYYAVWSRTYDTAGATTFDDTPYLYQGYSDATRGNNRSLIGFNWAQIKSDLTGASVRSVKLNMRNDFWALNAGGTTIIGTHNYSTKPSTWNTATVIEDRIRSKVWPKDATATRELGLTIGKEFKEGTTKGIALGPGPTTAQDYYGIFRGASQPGKPSLVITFVK